MKIAMIGYGYWGEKVYTTLLRFFEKENIFIIDTKKTLIDKNQITLKSLQNDPSINKVFIITPEETHYNLAKVLIKAKKDIFIEKPLCLNENEAKELVVLANLNGVFLFVDYIFLFDPFIQKIKETIEENSLGKIRLIQSTRHSIQIQKPNISVIQDLAIHDIYILRYLFNKKITIKQTIHQKKQHSQVYLKVGSIDFFGNYSWIHPKKNRCLTIVGTKRSIVWSRSNDFLEIYKNQHLEKKIFINDHTSPLYKSIDDFIKKDLKFTPKYDKDVALLEKMNTQIV